MTDNQKIAEWAGIQVKQMCCYTGSDVNGPCLAGAPNSDECGYLSEGGEWANCEWKDTGEPPDYHNDPGAALGLLDALERKEYLWDMSLFENGDKYIRVYKSGAGMVASAIAPTVSAVIVSAVLKIINKEQSSVQ